MKRCAILLFSSKNCKIQQCLMVFFSYRYNMRLISPCEIASDMTLWFSAFLNFRKKWANLRLPLNVQKQKVFQLQGGFAPLTPRPGALPPDPRYRLAIRALAMPPLLCQILNAPLSLTETVSVTWAAELQCQRQWLVQHKQLLDLQLIYGDLRRLVRPCSASVDISNFSYDHRLCIVQRYQCFSVYQRSLSYRWQRYYRRFIIQTVSSFMTLWFSSLVPVQ